MSLTSERVVELRRLYDCRPGRPPTGNFVTYVPWDLADAVPELLDEVERLQSQVEHWKNEAEYTHERLDRVQDALADEERQHAHTVNQRDQAEDWADRLADALAPADVLGEHSNANNPWANALAFANTPTAPVAHGADQEGDQ